MHNALFPGTFDPPSLGHLDIIKRASTVCDKLYVGIAVNRSKKNSLFFPEEKLELLRTMTKDLANVEVLSFSGLVIDFAQKHNIHVILRGLRAFSDFEYEFRMALANRKMSGLETMFLMADERYSYLSSTLIRDIASHGRRLTDFVPPEIEDKVFNRLAERYAKEIKAHHEI